MDPEVREKNLAVLGPALAEDLRAVLAIEPIRARSPGTIARLAKFARRRPATTMLLCVVLFGGRAPGYVALNDTWEYDAAADAWTRLKAYLARVLT